MNELKKVIKGRMERTENPQETKENAVGLDAKERKHDL